MKIYKYRWWCVSIVVLMLGAFSYWFILSAQAEELAHMQAQEKQLTVKLLSLKKAAAIKPIMMNTKMNRMDWLTILPALAEWHGVVMRSVAIKPKKGMLANEEKIKFVVEGDFSALTRFIVAMHEKAPSSIIENFTYQLTKQQTLLLTIDLLLVTHHFTPSQQAITKITELHNPFCLANYTVADVSTPDAAVSGLSITQMKMAGYFSQGARQTALVMLPTGALAEVHVGDEIGIEKAIVTRMTQEQVEVMLPGGERKIL